MYVLFMGERYRVVRHKQAGRDVVITNGHKTLTVDYRTITYVREN